MTAYLSGKSNVKKMLNETSGNLLDEVLPNGDSDTYDSELDTVKQLNHINALINQIQDKFLGNWLGVAYQKKIQERLAAHKADIKRYTDEIASLQMRLNKLKEEKEHNNEIINKQAIDTALLRSRLKVIQQETDSLLLDKEQKEKLLQKTCDKAIQLKEAVDAKAHATHDCATSLEKEVDFFRNRLGLQLKKVSGGRLQFIFTNIDNKEPTRPFCICVKINPDKTYTISDCQPQVPELDDLVHHLQDTNNFRSFVICLRQKFQNLIL